MCSRYYGVGVGAVLRCYAVADGEREYVAFHYVVDIFDVVDTVAPCSAAVFDVSVGPAVDYMVAGAGVEEPVAVATHRTLRREALFDCRYYTIGSGGADAAAEA